jgi:hypothetical protein
MHLHNPGFKLTAVSIATLLTVLGGLTFNQASLAQSNRQSTLSLRDMAKYYSGLPHQDRAFSLLQGQIDQINPSPLATDSIVGNVWRNADSFSGHVDVLSQISVVKRTGPDPLSLVQSFAPWGGDGIRPFNIEVLSGPEGRVIATIEIGYLEDDSVSGIRNRLDIKRNSNGQWEIIKAGRQYLCQRGHTGGEVGWAGSVCL